MNEALHAMMIPVLNQTNAERLREQA